jgi:hypothetical protein
MALQESIMRRHQTIEELTELLKRCDNLDQKGKQEN